MHQHLGLPLGFETIQHALDPASLASQHGLRQLENVEPGHIQYSGLHLCQRQLAGRVKESSFWISWCAASRLPSTRSAKN